MLKLQKNNRGDTLVEVMIAIAILSLVLAATYSLTSRGSQLSQSAKERTQAVAYAQGQAEIITAYAARDWEGFIDEINRTNGTKNSFINSSGRWRSQNNPLRPEPNSAANYEISYTVVEQENFERCTSFTCGAEGILQLEIEVNARWQPLSGAPTDGAGNPVPETTQLNLKVSRPGVENSS